MTDACFNDAPLELPKRYAQTRARGGLNVWHLAAAVATAAPVLFGAGMAYEHYGVGSTVSRFVGEETVQASKGLTPIKGWAIDIGQQLSAPAEKDAQPLELYGPFDLPPLSDADMRGINRSVELHTQSIRASLESGAKSVTHEVQKDIPIVSAYVQRGSAKTFNYLGQAAHRSLENYITPACEGDHGACHLPRKGWDINAARFLLRYTPAPAISRQSESVRPAQAARYTR